MLQKITSWFRLIQQQRLCGQGNPTLFHITINLKKFYHDHPHIGGGIIISFIIFMLLVGFFFWNLTPVHFGDKKVQIFKIQYGATLREIEQSLKNDGLIRNKSVFEIYVRLNPKQRMSRAGFYSISPEMSVPQIVKVLRQGIPPSIRITIPEGLTINQIADLLAQKGLVDRQKFINTTKDLSFINQVLGDYQLKDSEGYLFPDTYNIELNSNIERETVTKMLLRFKEVFQENFGTLSAVKREQIIIIASLVEKEAKKAVERPIIAGIFYNRLRTGYPLQSCATVQYALGKHKERLYYKDLEVSSPYNTYLHQGLPPGPIANPGLASLKAAVAPSKVNYLYFVAKPDGTHVFSTTYQQHLNAQRKIGILGQI